MSRRGREDAERGGARTACGPLRLLPGVGVGCSIPRQPPGGITSPRLGLRAETPASRWFLSELESVDAGRRLEAGDHLAIRVDVVDLVGAGLVAVRAARAVVGQP